MSALPALIAGFNTVTLRSHTGAIHTARKDGRFLHLDDGSVIVDQVAAEHGWQVVWEVPS